MDAYGKQIVAKNSSHHEIGAARANPNRQSERAKHLLAGNQANLCRRLRQAGFLQKCAAPLRLISAKVTAMALPSGQAPEFCLCAVHTAVWVPIAGMDHFFFARELGTAFLAAARTISALSQVPEKQRLASHWRYCGWKKSCTTW